MNENQEQMIASPLRAKIVGVGGAGCQMLEHVARTHLAQLPLAIIHTNARVLRQHAISERVLIGADRTFGLGTGGDDDLARVMAEQEITALKNVAQGAELIFLIAGLGGGTGSGIAPVLAKAAKASGALVIAIAVMPFHFEGPSRQKQAQAGLQMLRAAADAVICLPNEKLTVMLGPGRTVLEVFARANDLLVQGIRGLWLMLTRPGLINVDFAYLSSVLRGRHAESSLAMAEASGENRVQQVLDQLFCNPYWDRGEPLVATDHVLVSLAASANLTIAEINELTGGLRSVIGEAQLVLGTSMDESAPDHLSVMLLASKHGKTASEEDVPTLAARPPHPVLTGAIDGAFIEDVPVRRPAPRFVAPAPESTPQKTRELLEKQPGSRIRKGSPKWKQETLALEIVSRGRFEKSEPTIHRGADLDVPTYVRRGIPLN